MAQINQNELVGKIGMLMKRYRFEVGALWNQRYIMVEKLDKSLRAILFFLFFLLSIRFIFSYLTAAPDNISYLGILIALLIAVLSWWRLFPILYLFIGFIPLVAGIQNLGLAKGIPIFSFIFANIYISWFLRRFFYKKKGIIVNNSIDTFIDIFAVVIILSLIMRLSAFPFDFVVYRFQFASVLRQNDPFWCFEASYIILQGLFVYRILSLEKNKDWIKWINSLFVIQTIIIIIFSFIQFFLLVLNKQSLDTIKIFWPFDDIHSYGSYIIFLFFYHTAQIFLKKKFNFFSLTIGTILFFLIVFSYSRATWLAFMIVFLGIVFFTVSIRKRKWIVFCFVFIFLIGNFLGPQLLKANNLYLKRLGRLVAVNNYSIDKTIQGRLHRWKVALRMVKDHPITGTGIGTYLGVSPNYISSEEVITIRKVFPRWKIEENTHNYFLQRCAQIGLLGLFFFGAILFSTYRVGFGETGYIKRKNFQMYGLISGLTAYLITMITSHPLIISKQQFLFWFIIFAITIEPSDKEKILVKSKIGTVIFSLPFVILVVLMPGYLLNGRTIEKIEGVNYEYGFYKKEKIEKRKVRWTMKMSGSKEFAKTDIIGVRVYAMHDNISEENLYLDIFINDFQIDRVYFKKTGFKRLYYHIPGIKNHEYLLRTMASKTFNPYKLGLTKNLKQSRDQGVALERIRYLTKLPKKKYKKIDFTTISEESNSKSLNGIDKNT